MRNPILVTMSHTEPIIGDGFSGALERVAVGLYTAARMQGLSPEGRARVRVVNTHGDLNHGRWTLLVGSLLGRPGDLPDDRIDPWADGAPGVVDPWADEPPC